MGRRRQDMDEDDGPGQQPPPRRSTSPHIPPVTSSQSGVALDTKRQPADNQHDQYLASGASVTSNSTTETPVATSSSHRSSTSTSTKTQAGGSKRTSPRASTKFGGSDHHQSPQLPAASAGNGRASNNATTSRLRPQPQTFRQARYLTPEEDDGDGDATTMISEDDQPGAIAMPGGVTGPPHSAIVDGENDDDVDDGISALTPTTAAESALPIAAIAAEVASRSSSSDVNISEIVAEVLRQQQNASTGEGTIPADAVVASSHTRDTNRNNDNNNDVGTTDGDSSSESPQPQEAVVMDQKLYFGIPRIWWIVGGIIAILVIALGVTMGVTLSQKNDGDTLSLLPSLSPVTGAQPVAPSIAPPEGTSRPTIVEGNVEIVVGDIDYDLVANILGKENGDTFGHQVVLSKDGTTMAVAANKYVRVFRRRQFSDWDDRFIGGTLNFNDDDDDSVRSIALSDDGNRLVVGITNTQINGGYVSVFDYNGADTWVMAPASPQLRRFNLPDFGADVALEGSMLAVSAPMATSVSNTEQYVGFVQVYNIENNDIFIPVGPPLYGESEGDKFGYAISMSSSSVGNTDDVKFFLAVQSRGNGGLVTVYEYDNETEDDGRWESLGQIIENIANPNENGKTLVIAVGGQMLGVIGSNVQQQTRRVQQGRNIRGLADATGEEQQDVRVYRFGCCSWERMEIDISTSIGQDDAADSHMASIAIADSGQFLALGVTGAASNSTLLYRNSNNELWELIASFNGANGFGYSTSLSGNGSQVVVGASQSTTVPGEVFVYSMVDEEDIVTMTPTTLTQGPTVLEPAVSNRPTEDDTIAPTSGETQFPTRAPITPIPTMRPSVAPVTQSPTETDTTPPTTKPTQFPTKAPITSAPTRRPSAAPTTQTPTSAPTRALCEIVSIEEESGEYLVYFETNGFAPVNPGQHVHFFFDTVPPDEAGMPGSGPWQLYPAGPGQPGTSPFRLYDVSQKPNGASQMCILVANQDHSVRLGTGNCVDLPVAETLAPTSSPTKRPTPTPTTAPTVALSSQILSIEVDSGQYIVEFETTGFLPVNPGRHVHFFFDTVLPEQAGVPGSCLGSSTLQGKDNPVPVPLPYSMYPVAPLAQHRCVFWLPILITRCC